MAVCAGGAGLAPEERAEVLTILTADKDEVISQRAEEALVTVAVEAFLTALKRPDAPEQLFHYCAANLAEKSGIADAMVDNPACPGDLMIEVAPYLTTAVNALIEDLDRLTATPGLITALAPCAGLSAGQRAVLQELQKDDVVETAFSEEAAEAEVAQVKDPAEKGRRLSLFQRVSKMRVVEKVQLALKGGKDERTLLIRDSNKMVQRAVLQSPRITDQEIEGIAGMTSLSDEILRLVAASRNFIKNYVIVKKLVNNPKTPLDVSLHLLARLTAQDMRFLCMNKNIPDTLRTTAIKLERQRKTSKPSAE